MGEHSATFEPGDPDHVRADHVGPGIGRAIDAERLLVRGPGADHAQPAVVIDERRLQADARELAEQIRLLGRQAGAAEHRDGAGPVRLLEARDLGGDAVDGLRVWQRTESGCRRRVPSQRRGQAIGMRALQVALHAFRAQHAAVEGELLPRLEADHLVVADLELNAALLSAEAAVRLHEPIGLDAGRQPRAGHRREVRAEALDDAEGIRRESQPRLATFMSSSSLVAAFEVLSPQGALRQAEERAPALGADVLVVAATRQLVAKAEFLLDDGQVAHHRPRRQRVGRIDGTPPARSRAPASL